MDPKKLRKTTIDNVYVYVEDDFDLVGGRQEKYTFYDFSNIQPINVDSDTITINDKNYNIDDVLYKKYYKDLDPSFKRLRIYSDRHTFETVTTTILRSSNKSESSNKPRIKVNIITILFPRLSTRKKRSVVWLIQVKQ